MWPALLHYGLNLKKNPIKGNKPKKKCPTIFTSAINNANTLTLMFDCIISICSPMCASTSIACNDNNNEHTLHL